MASLKELTEALKKLTPSTYFEPLMRLKVTDRETGNVFRLGSCLVHTLQSFWYLLEMLPPSVLHLMNLIYFI